MPSWQIQTYTVSDGIELSFTDSGAPPDSRDYTTVLFVHGGVFNAYQFRKVHAHAHALNLRTVLIHRRDYAGSTPYSSSEIEELEQGSAAFWERLSAQVAEFMEIFIKRERIPKLNRQKSSSHFLQANSANTDRGGNGGVAIFGWSAGCSTVLSLLGLTRNPMISEDLYIGLQEYIGNCIIYDPPYFCFGYIPPSDNRNYIPWNDPAVSAEDLPGVVAEWISSYYDHPCYDPVSQSLSSKAGIHDLDGIRQKGDRMSVSSWTDEETAMGLEGTPAKNEVLAFSPSPQKTLRSLSERALFDEESASMWFPDVGVTYIAGTRSNWVCAWAEIETKKRYLQVRFSGSEERKNCLGKGPNARKLRFFDMDGLNHLAHWDHPREFMEVVAESVKAHSLGPSRPSR